MNQHKRDKAWRRYQCHIKNGRGQGTKFEWKPEKKWRHIYMRSCKIARAKQLGFDYPRINQRQLLVQELELS